MTIYFEIVTANIHHLSNVTFDEKVAGRWLSSQLSTSAVRRVSENKVYIPFDVTAALLERIQ